MSVADDLKQAYEDGFVEGFNLGRKAAPRWHRVEDWFPGDGFIGKLVCDDEGQISICHGFATVTLANGKVIYTDSRIFDVFGEETDLWDDVTHFTHWMPIEPPKEDA